MESDGAPRPATFVETVKSFLETADWLNDSHGPSVKALEALAAELDREVTAALIAQFGLLHRSLLKERPQDNAPINPFEELLRR